MKVGSAGARWFLLAALTDELLMHLVPYILSFYSLKVDKGLLQTSEDTWLAPHKQELERFVKDPLQSKCCFWCF